MNKILAQTLVGLAGIVRGTLGSAFSYLNTLIKSGFNSAMQFHQEGIAFAREMGMSAKEAQAYTKVLTDRTEQLAMKYGVAAEKVLELQRNISVATSRQLMLNDSQAEQFLQLNKLVGSSTTTKFTEEMMNGMGGQLETVTGAVSKAYATAAKSGLNAQKVSEKIASNLSMANRLSFRTGIDGLTRMAMQAEKVGMSLQSVEAVANNFMEIDDAIEHAAQLNMLGGAAGIFGGNPLDMAYEANYDPEVLQKRMTSMLGGLAQFDAKTGMANINGVNMDFARQIAKAMGISPEEAARVAKKNAEVKFKESNLNLGGMNLTQEQRDFLINKSNVKDGKIMFTTSDNKEIDLSNGSANGILNKDVLAEMMKYQNMSDRDIMEENAKSLSSINEILTGIKDSIKAMFAKFIEGLFPTMQGDLKNFGAWAKGTLLPLAKNVGEATRGAYDWLKQHQEPIKSLIGGVIGFLKFATEHWKILIGFFVGKKLLGMFNSVGIGKGLGAKAASGAAKISSNLLKEIWNASKGMTDARYHYNANRFYGNGKIMSAIKAPFQAFGKLSTKGKALTSGGAALGIGLGAYNAITADNNADRGAGVGTAIGTALGAAVGGPIGAAIGGFLGDFAGRYIGEHWGEISETIKNSWNSVVDGAKSAWNWISDGAKSVWNWISDGAKSVWNLGKSAFKPILNFGTWLIDNNPIAWIAESIGSVFGKDWTPSNLIKNVIDVGEGHANGGIVSSKDNVVGVAKGEIVLDKTMQENLVSILKNPSVQAKPVGEKEYIYTPNRSTSSNINGNTITVKDFNINLSGTLKLDGGKTSKNIDINELLRDQEFMTALKNMIKTSINQDINGGRFTNDLATMAGFPAQTGIYGR